MRSARLGLGPRKGESKLDLLLLFTVIVLGLLVLAWWRMPEVQRAVRLVADQIEAKLNGR